VGSLRLHTRREANERTERVGLSGVQCTYNKRQSYRHRLHRQPCRRSRRRSPWRRRSVAGRRCLRGAGVAAQAGPHDSVHALARQDEDVLAVVLPEREDVAEQRVGATGGGFAGDRRALGAAQGYHSRGVVPAALRGLCAGPHQR
jgi:hypothetical protein